MGHGCGKFLCITGGGAGGVRGVPGVHGVPGVRGVPGSSIFFII